MHQVFDRNAYTFRILSTLIIVQVIVLLFIKLWPVSFQQNPIDEAYPNPEVIVMEEIVSTLQAPPTPPPVAPLPPVIMPDDSILPEELILDFDPLYTIGVTVKEPPTDSESAPSIGIERSIPPKPIRIVTPEYPRPAQRRRVRAEIIVSVVVDKSGNVKSPRILERYLLNESGRAPALVDELGYGLEQAAVNAALKSFFRPAKKGGAAIDSHHKLSFKFGI